MLPLALVWRFIVVVVGVRIVVVHMFHRIFHALNQTKMIIIGFQNVMELPEAVQATCLYLILNILAELNPDTRHTQMGPNG